MKPGVGAIVSMLNHHLSPVLLRSRAGGLNSKRKRELLRKERGGYS